MTAPAGCDRAVGLRRPSAAAPALIVLALALSIRLGFVAFHTAPPIHGDMITYEGIAKNIVDGRWHFGWDDEPSAHREPIYPLFVAGLYRVFGPSRGAVHVAQALLCSGTCALLVLLSFRMLKSRAAATLAGVMAAAYPPFIMQIQTILTEPLATALLLLATYFVVVGWTEGKRGALVLGGLFLGLATLTRAAVLMYAPLVALALAIRGAGPKKVGLKGAVALAVVFLAVLSPWTARNYLVFHRFIPVGVNAGGSFFRGNYDEGTLGSMGSNVDPRMPPEITARYEGLDEVDIDRLLMREGLKYVRSHPLTFVKLCALKLGRFWLNVGFAGPPSRTSIAFALGSAILLALALFGIFRSGLVDHNAAAPVYLLVVYYTALHMLLFATARYSIPVMPYALAFAAAGLLGLARLIAPGLIPAGWISPSAARS